MTPALRGAPAAAICAFALALTAGTAAAALYKWTDANGRVVYSDQPPAGNVKIETLQGPPPPSNPTAVKDLANRELEFKQRQLDKQDAQKAAESERLTAKEKLENCAQVQGQLKQLGEDNLVLWRLNAAGERVEMSSADRRTERDRLARWFRDSKCQG
ncbi:MAG: DUF4124 domain-containing protein [Casimicrobiaceae bacterium]